MILVAHPSLFENDFGSEEVVISRTTIQRMRERAAQRAMRMLVSLVRRLTM
jgi:hypothetical protein